MWAAIPLAEGINAQNPPLFSVEDEFFEKNAWFALLAGGRRMPAKRTS